MTNPPNSSHPTSLEARAEKSELLPCPICGKEPHAEATYFDGEFQYFAIECPSPDHFCGVHDDNEEDAEKAWNTRHQPIVEALKVEVEELKAQCIDWSNTCDMHLKAGDSVLKDNESLRKQIEALKGEVEELKNQHGEYVAGKATLKQLAIRNGTLTASVGTEMAQIMASQFMDMLDKCNAENYIEMQFTERKTMKFITVTIQRHEKKTPHQIRQELENENESLRKQIEQLTKDNEELKKPFNMMMHAKVMGDNEKLLKQVEELKKSYDYLMDVHCKAESVYMEQEKQIEQLTAEMERANKTLSFARKTQCTIHPASSRICEFGSNGCNVMHDTSRVKPTKCVETPAIPPKTV